MEWTEFYRERDYDRIAYLAGEEMPDLLERFFERTRVPETMLSVGCGPAVTEFAVAERHPETSVHGVDVSEDLMRDNRDLAADANVENLTFAVDTLPDLDTDGEYDLVYCVATLFFVKDVDRALESLWDRVAPGGHLVVSYPSSGTRRGALEMDEQSQAFFSLVVGEENLRTRADVESVLGVKTADFWAAVDAPDEPFVTFAPTVVVQKEQ
ncbi:class I SAM-dependent methyltransferase [Halomarina oriensis]|uniref:Methyltransferase domain-containing protein n=1 Tax=Halomarina oriensis TaxID=671145 RepID=A0A6B0GS62_9EURY|nr:class I SAM-dependent methyltransferase [Halomarina oriensis]MWG34925.1 methyltransferase domain-containing protein [Halomarina oriensis]